MTQKGGWDIWDWTVSFGGLGKAEAQPSSRFLLWPLTLKAGLRAGLLRLLGGWSLLA